MGRSMLRTKGDRWCKLEVRLEDHDGFARLSICGVAGRIVKRSEAKRESLSYWESFFEEAPQEIFSMNQRFRKRFTSAKGAARFVLKSDGEFHGLDTDGPTDGKTIRVAESFGQIRETIAEFFPEAVPYFKWHLNDVRAECIHQEERGENYTTHPSAVCPECGWKLGHAWDKRELPADVIAWAKGAR
jgi:hypothetical protein